MISREGHVELGGGGVERDWVDVLSFQFVPNTRNAKRISIGWSSMELFEKTSIAERVERSNIHE